MQCHHTSINRASTFRRCTFSWPRRSFCFRSDVKKHHAGKHKCFADHVSPQLRTRTVQYYKLPADETQHAMSSQIHQSNIHIIITTLRKRGKTILSKSCATCLLIAMYEHQCTSSWQQRTVSHRIYVQLPMAGKDVCAAK